MDADHPANRVPFPRRITIDAAFCGKVIVWVAGSGKAEANKCLAVRSIKRILSAIGTPTLLLPPNPFTENTSGPARQDSLDAGQARRLLKQAKFEANVVIRRTREAHRLSATGRDPRSGKGSARSRWNRSENRAWVVKRLLKRKLSRWEDLKIGAHRAVIPGFAGREGAEYVADDGSVRRQTGLSGHLRWFFPTGSDVTPFVTLMQLRTGWNLSTVAAIQSRRWMEPYPFRLGTNHEETHVWIVSSKTRGRRDTLSRSSVQKVPSAKKPWSHPYRILKFVEYLTAGLRREINVRIRELVSVAGIDGARKSELDRLEAIKDDLFIYKNEQGITSLRLDSESADFKPLFARAGLAVTTRHLRDASILFAFEKSGHNLLVAQIFAGHSDSGTTTLYLRRKRTLDRYHHDASRVFAASLDLIREDAFTTSSLRALLARQGFSDAQVDSLTSPETVTRWGNNCADPNLPPPGFGVPADGSACRKQDCIDGCPHARWFRGSLDHVARQLVQAERQASALGIDASGSSSLESRIERCKALLSSWPSSMAEPAVANARLAGPSSADLLLGVPA